MLRIADAMLHCAVCCQYHETFTVCIEPAGRVHVRDGDEILERPSRRRSAELAQDAVRLVEQQQFAHRPRVQKNACSCEQADRIEKMRRTSGGDGSSVRCQIAGQPFVRG
jgi:hypothetical protein